MDEQKPPELPTTETRLVESKRENAPPPMTPREEKFYLEYAKTNNLSLSAAKAFGSSKLPKHKDPVRFARRLLSTSGYDAVLMEYVANKQGLTDVKLFQELAQGLDTLQWDGKGEAKIKLAIIQEAMKLKGRYQPERPKQINIDNRTQNTQTNVKMQSFINNARNELDDDEILKILDKTVDNFEGENVTEHHVPKEIFSEGDNLGLIADVEATERTEEDE